MNKITGDSVYSGRVEVTRHFSFSVHTGRQTRLTFLDCPRYLIKIRSGASDSLLVTPLRVNSNSAELQALKLTYKQTKKALERSQKDIASLETYLRSVNAEHVAVTALGEVVENYESGLYTRKAS